MNKLFTADFSETNIGIPPFSFNNIDDLEDLVNELEENDNYYDYFTLDIKITINEDIEHTGGIIGFIHEFDKLDYDLLVAIGAGDYDEFWEDEGHRNYYAYKYLVNNNMLSAEDAIEKCEKDEVAVFFGDKDDYAREYVSEMLDLPDWCECYFDFDKFADNLVRDGEITEVADEVWIVNANQI